MKLSYINNIKVYLMIETKYLVKKIKFKQLTFFCCDLAKLFWREIERG